MFARKLIFRTACGLIRSKYTQLLFVWVYGERRVHFYVISAPLKSWNPSYSLSNNNFSLLSPRLRDRSVALFHACAKVFHSLNNGVLKQQFDAVPFLPLCYIFDGLSPDSLQTQTNAQKTQIVVRCSSKEKILKVRRFIPHFLCIS